MKKTKLLNFLFSFEQIPSLLYLLKWILICLVLGAIAGSVSALFLFTLEWATDWRESHLWIIFFLPVGGFIIGLSYHLFGTSVVKGNNLLLEELHSPRKIIPFRMAPLIFIGLARCTAYLFSGHSGVYSSQITGSTELTFFIKK